MQPGYSSQQPGLCNPAVERPEAASSLNSIYVTGWYPGNIQFNMNTKPPRPLLSSFLRGDRAGRADFDLPRHSRTTQGLSLCCFNIVGGEILTFLVPRHSHYSGDRLSLWCFNIVGGEISTYDLPRHSHYSGVIPMVFEHSGGRDFDLPRHSHYSGVIPMVFQHSGTPTRSRR